MSETATDNFFKSKVLGHPSGLFVLFFTEMWERFSFYGMRVLLINFLTMAIIGSNPGWEWSADNAGSLFGTYAGLLYLTPIAGGIIADKFIGYRWAVVIGALIMTAGHAFMAIETEFSLYMGLALLVIGTGFFKPNMTSIISEMYKDLPQKKDGAYTIFYMGVNAGAFFGMMMCGYLAEKIGWSWGFGLAGVFMLLGSLQFWLAKPLFGKIGEVPNKEERRIEEERAASSDDKEEKRNPFTTLDKILIVITSYIGLSYLLNDPMSKIGGIHILPEKFIVDPAILGGPSVILLLGLGLFLFLAIGRIIRYPTIVRDRMFAVIIFAFFTVFFWLSFEQGATSLVLFARDYTDRVMEGSAATIFKIVNTILTIGPLAIITWVLALLFKNTFKKIGLSNIVLALSFVGLWAIAIWMLNRDFSSNTYQVEYQAQVQPKLDKETGEQLKDEKTGELIFTETAITESQTLPEGAEIKSLTANVTGLYDLEIGKEVALHTEIGNLVYLPGEMEDKIRSEYASDATKESLIINGTITKKMEGEIEITTSWFSILNSFFIIAFASFFSKWWDSKYNPSAAMKYALGLIIMGIGFALLAYGSMGIGGEGEIVKVSIVWLILAYLFHTLGELCLSPLGLSYVSKLVPGRMIAFMFGMWYLAIAIGNKLAGSLGGQIEKITEEYSMTTFFLIFTIVPIVAGIVVAALNPVLKKLMHGVK